MTGNIDTNATVRTNETAKKLLTSATLTVNLICSCCCLKVTIASVCNTEKLVTYIVHKTNQPKMSHHFHFLRSFIYKAWKNELV